MSNSLRFKDISISKKLIIILAIMIAGFLVFGAYCFSSLNYLKVNGPVYNNIVMGKDLVADILPPPDYILESYMVVLQLSEENDSTKIDQLSTYLTGTLEKEYYDRHKYWADTLPSGDIKNTFIIDSYAPADEFYTVVNNEFIPAVKNKDLVKANALAKGILKEKYDAHRAQIDKVVLLANGANSDTEAFAKDEITKRTTLLIIIAILSIVISMALYFIITTSLIRSVKNINKEVTLISKSGDLSSRMTVSGNDEIGEMAGAINEMLDNTVGPVKELSKVAETIANGDLTVKINVKATGDVAKLVDSMTVMASSLEEFVGNVARNANVAATSAEELSASSEEVNASSEQVSSTIQEIARGGQNLTKLATETKNTVSFVSDATRQVASNAQKTSEGAKKAGIAADAGMKAGQKANAVMTDILRSTQQTAKDMSELDEKSKQIGKIIEVINGISSQTNLLALNAAIEAARAGEAGRGFAVVADEVRKLAEESHKATTQISDMINSIQDGTKRSVDGMNASSRTVQEGTIVVEDALKALEQIAIISKEVGSQVLEISAAAEEASVGVAKVSKDIMEVSAVAEESAAGTQEVSASMEQTVSSMTQVSTAAQALAKGAEELRQLVSKFKVDSSVTRDIEENDKRRLEVEERIRKLKEGSKGSK